MRFWVALAVAGLIIALGVLFVWHTQRSIEERFRQGLREARIKGTLLPGIDPDQANPGDFGITLSAAEMRRMEIANLFIAWRFVLIPMVLIVSLGCSPTAKASASTGQGGSVSVTSDSVSPARSIGSW